MSLSHLPADCPKICLMRHPLSIVDGTAPFFATGQSLYCPGFLYPATRSAYTVMPATEGSASAVSNASKLYSGLGVPQRRLYLFQMTYMEMHMW